jgi:hypothetical protein
MRALDHGNDLHLYLEVIAFCQELIKVAPAGLQCHCYLRSAYAMVCLQKLDEAEEMVHEGLAACPEDDLEKQG